MINAVRWKIIPTVRSRDISYPCAYSIQISILLCSVIFKFRQLDILVAGFSEYIAAIDNIVTVTIPFKIGIFNQDKHTGPVSFGIQ